MIIKSLTMSVYKLNTGSEIHYDKSKVLAPDVVTEELAFQATKVILEKKYIEIPKLLELGIGTGAFSRFVLDNVGIQVDITGIDIDPNAIETARTNLENHPHLSNLKLSNADWSTKIFDDERFDIVYFNPPYLKEGTLLRSEFIDAPENTVFSSDAKGTYAALLPRIIHSLNVGGIALIRYPGDGSLTYAGSDAKTNHDPWVSFEEVERTMQRLRKRSKWLKEVMPSDTRVFSWRSSIGDRRINADMFTRIGNDIKNAPKLIRDIDDYWEAYE
jgi:methylase of polypeptide subunit release factors